MNRFAFFCCLTISIFISSHTWGQGPQPYWQSGGFTYLNADQSSAFSKIWEEAGPFIGGLASVRENNHMGIIDASGHYLLPPLYEEIVLGKQWQVKRSGLWYLYLPNSKTWSQQGYLSISPLKGGLFRVERPEGFTLMDSNAQVLLPESYEWLDHHYDQYGVFTDLILLRTVQGRGLANWCGEIVLPPTFQRIGLVHDQWSVVMHNFKFGLIDLEGRMVIPCEYENLYPPSEGMVPAKLGNLWGFISPDGEPILPFRYTAVNRTGFFRGQAGVELYGEWVMIDRKGKEDLLVAKPWINLGELSEGLVAAAMFSVEKNLKYGFVDPEGKTRIGFQYDKAFAFEGGLAVVGLRNALSNSVIRPMRYGIIDRKGKTIVPVELDRPHRATTLRDSLIRFGSISWYKGLRRCRIYKNGRTQKCNADLVNKLLFKYDGLRCPQASLKAIRKDEKWGFCDENGKLAIPFKYDQVECFDHGLAKVWRYDLGDHYFYINESGDELVWENPIGN